MNIFLGYLLTYLYVFFIIIVASLFHKKEAGRKFIHIFVAFAWFIMNHFFGTSFHIVIPPLTFIVLNYLSYKKNIFKSMERDKGNTPGTVYYAVSMTIMAAITVFIKDFNICYAIGLFIMALADGMAPIVAEAIKSPVIYNEKTYAGTITVFIITLTLLLCTLRGTNYLYIILCAIYCTCIELYSKKGLDNIFLPLTSSFLIYILFV